MNKVEFELSWPISVLRDQGKAVGQPNDGFGGLGQEFGRLIRDLGGGRVGKKNYVANWTGFRENLPIGRFGLPKTSAKFWLDANQWPRLEEFIKNHS